MNGFSVATGRAVAMAMTTAIGIFGAGCGGASGGSDVSGASDHGSVTPSAEGSMAGVYSATYSGSYTATSQSGTLNGTNTATATITVTDLGAGQIQAVWQLGANPPSGTIDFAMTGEDGTAVGTPTGGACFHGLLDNGNTQTNCCTSCAIAFSGTTFTQPNTGTMTGVTPAGVSYSGTYTGQWVAQRQ
jgi:hypothetical protein